MSAKPQQIAIIGAGINGLVAANILQRFVTHSGIRGSFRILFDAEGKFSGIERLGTSR